MDNIDINDGGGSGGGGGGGGGEEEEAEAEEENGLFSGKHVEDQMLFSIEAFASFTEDFQVLMRLLSLDEECFVATVSVYIGACS